mgnify:CR=1 FL=1
MNAVVDCPLLQAQQQLATQIATACDRVAPTWPLDQFIAVNPYWGWVQRPVAQAAATLGTLVGTRLTAPRAWLRAHRRHRGMARRRPRRCGRIRSKNAPCHCPEWILDHESKDSLNYAR